MDSVATEEYPNLARLVEITNDAVALCHRDGSVLHVNKQFLRLVSSTREHIVDSDIKDILFSETFERAAGHRLPFTVDGADNTLMLKLFDGSFIPVNVRSLMLDPTARYSSGSASPHVLIVMQSLEERYAHDRQTQRLLSELQAANKRLSGTLSVIMSTVGSEDLPSLVDTVLNRLVDTLDADGSAIYFSESGGFKLRGISDTLRRDYVPEFIPYGTGIASHLLRESRSCRFSIVPADDGAAPISGSFYDLDARLSIPVRVQDMPPFKTIIVVPVFFGTQILGIIELGWRRHTTPRMNEVRVLEVICDYLSIELVGLITALRSRKTAELTRSLNALRDSLLSLEGDAASRYAQMGSELRRVLSCRLCPIVYDRIRDAFVIDFEGGSRVALPSSPEELFLSMRVPASRASGPLGSDAPAGVASTAVPSLKAARVVRIDRATQAGTWLSNHGLPCQGAYVDLGMSFDMARDALSDEDGIEEPLSSAPVEEGIVARGHGVAGASSRLFLLLRNASQEPIDDLEYDYLVRLVHDFELIANGAQSKKEERRIAQTLQAGMRSSLGVVPGITADSRYSSATRQALVGGDFYTLLRLPDDRAVMILGDVSGKGVEAASMSALVKTALTAYAWEGRPPAALARALNGMLMGFSRVETFATMFIAKIDLRSRTATYCSAGHPPTMLIRPPRGEAARSGEVELLSVQSGVVGAFDSMVYENGVFTFKPGDMLFMYTDGAIEARDARGGFFGEERLREVLLRESGNGIEGLCDTVLSELDEFSGSALDDDIALVALRFDAVD